MRPIHKRPAPRALVELVESANENWHPCWEDLDGEAKNEVKQSLLEEQGYLCCYCEGRTSSEDAHIEHLLPRSRPQYRDRALDYRNLLASCSGGQNDVPVRQHCGPRKSDRTIPVSPLDSNCGSYFRFTVDGQILPTDAAELRADAERTIQVLGLGIAKLRALREQAIKGLFDVLPETVDEARRLLEGYDRPDRDGKRLPYASAVIHILRSEFLPPESRTKPDGG